MILKDFKRYLKHSGILALIIILLHFSFLFFLPEHYAFSFGFGLTVFLYVFFALLHYVYLRLIEHKSPGLFIRVFMFLTFIKMILLLFLLTLYILFNRQNALPFIIVFGLCYLGFSLIEVSHIFKRLKSTSEFPK